MEDVNGQLQTKYQKIATEYSKIRAQANVLKKAVIEEQSKNGELREQFKEKEVKLRRAEQELDSLTFRNQQLTKRVTVLQEELDSVQNKGRKGRSKSSESKAAQSPIAANRILDEEFQKKIVENAQLLSQIIDKDNEIEYLHERVQQLEYKIESYEKLKSEMECKSVDIIKKLEKEKAELERKLNSKQNVENPELCSNSEIKSSQSGDYVSKSSVLVLSSPLPTQNSRNERKPTVEVTPLEEKNDELKIAKLFDLEKELSRWKAQYNILKIKYDELEAMNNEQNAHNQLDTDSLAPKEITNMIGRLNTPFPIPEEIEAREAKIKDYFIREIDNLVNEKHLCHVKNLSIAANTEVMNVHLDTSEAKREKCEAFLLETLSKWRNLQEDKEEQEGNYKAQLSTMSEHLANMNDKLIQQTEEIQQLKFELANKNAKKGKQK
ncbi:protein phosphatase 1 regulatory subunit 21 [Cephus cinctus]|uniref:Protein phosphatase 1 regulatory subunit 21 n=1 Tax=Cephus cinctus TaxID=211228 RepID=A0AAJ7FF65_CEPCN|nr:protein phosphatase 1 regulatory subunit 21 [Cephus cinctus]